MKHGDVSRCVRTVKLQQEMLHTQLPRAQPQIDLTSCSISIVKQAHYMMNSILCARVLFQLITLVMLPRVYQEASCAAEHVSPSGLCA